MTAALDGIRVLDIGTYLAGPFGATILGEFGAEVIKVERPGVGDGLRGFGTDTECGDTLIWLSEARNKKSITLDLSRSEGREVLRELIAVSDVVVENFRPGVLERWGLDYPAIRALNPGCVLVRVSAYGQTGPMASQPAFARIAHGFAGLSFLAGEPDGRPVIPGATSLADYITGLYVVVGTMMALRARETTGFGQEVDLSLFEPTFRTLDEIAPAYQQFGFVRRRMGADTINVVPHSHYQCADGAWVAIACTNDEMWARLATAMGRPELAGGDLYGPKAQRVAARDEVNRIVTEWVGAHSHQEVLDAFRTHQVPGGPLHSIADIFDDPQYRERGTIVEVDSRIGPLAVPRTLPALSDTPGEIKWLGPALGEHTDDVLADVLGKSPDEVAALHDRGIV